VTKLSFQLDQHHARQTHKLLSMNWCNQSYCRQTACQWCQLCISTANS